MDDIERDKRIAGLLRERASFQRSGREDYAAEVTKQLEQHGYAESAEPQGRSTPQEQQQTADQPKKRTPRKQVAAQPEESGNGDT